MFYSGGHPKNLKWPMTIYDHLIAGATSLWKAELHRAGWQKRTAGWAQPSRKDHSLIESISREISGEWLGELFWKATIFIYLQGFGHLWKTYRTSKPAKFEKKTSDTSRILSNFTGAGAHSYPPLPPSGDVAKGLLDCDMATRPWRRLACRFQRPIQSTRGGNVLTWHC